MYVYGGVNNVEFVLDDEEQNLEEVVVKVVVVIFGLIYKE